MQQPLWSDFLQTQIPLISAQLFIVFLVYFTVVRKQLGEAYPYYACFLASFSCFLMIAATPVTPLEIPMMHAVRLRMFLLFSLSLPSLLIATFLHSKVRIPRRGKQLIYLAGFSWGVCFVILNHIAWEAMFGPNPQPDAMKLFIRLRILQLINTSLLLILPALYLLLKKQNHSKPYPIIYANLLFGGLMAFGILFKQWWVYYTGSIICALIWGGAIYQDIRQMRGRSEILKEELRFLVGSGQAASDPKLGSIINELVQHSGEDLQLYKLRVREVLAMLTQLTIESGADSESLLKRVSKSESFVNQNDDSKQIQEMVRSEAAELSTMISSLAESRQHDMADKVKAYIAKHYHRKISINEIAEDLHSSRSHLMSIFKNSTGSTINQYLTQLRIEKAKLLLKSNSVTETAFAVGFNDSNYFSTVFKKQTAMSPWQYQQEDAAKIDT